MAGNVDRIILLPRYTALVGVYDETASAWQALHTAPIQVSQYASAIVSLWGGVQKGAAMASAVLLQESSDLENWADVSGSSSLGGVSDSESTVSVSFSLDWLRLSLTLSATWPDVPAQTFWCVGDFLRRGM